MTIDRGPWIQTFSGGKFFPLDPKPEEIHIEDIAHSLSLQCRFLGHVKSFYSVGQHSVLVSSYCQPENAFWGLLHDSSEAYICDMSRPLKHSLEMKEYRKVEHDIMMAVAEAYDLPYDIPADVKNIDSALCMAEAKQLLGTLIDGWSTGVEPINVTIIPWTPHMAEGAFIRHFNSLQRIHQLKMGYQTEG